MATVATVALLAAAPCAFADDAGAADLQQTIQQLRAQLEAQESRLAELEGRTTPAELQRVVGDMRAEAGNHAFADWMENLELSGDLRLRFHWECTGAGRPNVHKGRFRLRFGLTKTFLDKQMEVGFRLASGTEDSDFNFESDPATTNQDFSNWFSEKKIWIDRAYAKYMPVCLPGLTIVGGKMANPFVSSNVVWDSDVNPEGVWAVYKFGGLKDDLKLEPFAGMGIFLLQPDDSDGSDASAVEMHGYQAGVTWEVLEGVKWISALAYYDYTHLEKFWPDEYGNTSSAGRLSAEEFNLFNIYNQVAFEAMGLPMSLTIDYVHNCQDEYVSSNETDDAFAVFFKVGKNTQAGDWSFLYKWAYVEANSVVGAFSDSDFGRANRTGHQFGGAYNLTDFLEAGLKVYVTRPIIGTGSTDVLVLADLIWTF